MADLGDLMKDQAAGNRPGIGKKILYALVTEFTTISKTTDPATATTLAEEATIATDHAFVVGKGWKVLETTDEFNELSNEVIGDRDSRWESASLECRHPGLKAEALAVKKRLLGREVILLLPNLDGTYLQLGNEEDPMEVQGTSASGNKAGGYKGTTFTISGYSEIAVYEGAIALESEIL